MAAELPEPLAAYLADREQQRTDRVTAFLDSLTDYERGLVHDAAVMGYVQGLMRDRSEGAPKDSQTMALVIKACFVFADLYPTVNAEFEDRRQTVEYFVQGQQPDGTWEQCSSTSTDPGFVVERLTARRRMHPDVEFRIARRTTRVIVDTVQATEAQR
ncbi:hypothetical protein ACIQ7D_17965 [Streptomyces sp. NPDC096310]|uniref:hypothetical protein n=1 Tax=Streptomyces sp. NPDC096310 TaxID=3366082 RepID=UPI0038006E01